MKCERDRCYVRKIDIHRASMSRDLKSKKHLENISKNKVFIPRKNPIKRNVKVLDFDIKDENLYYFTDKILKRA